jgi:hypothetical protein
MAHVDRVDNTSTPLEQNRREASRRCADIKRGPTGDFDTEPVESRSQLHASTQFRSLADNDRATDPYERSGVAQHYPVDEHGSRFDMSSRVFEVRTNTRQFVDEPNASRHDGTIAA